MHAPIQGVPLNCRRTGNTQHRTDSSSSTLILRGPSCSSGAHPDWVVSNVSWIVVRFTTCTRIAREKREKGDSFSTEQGTHRTQVMPNKTRRTLK